MEVDQIGSCNSGIRLKYLVTSSGGYRYKVSITKMGKGGGLGFSLFIVGFGTQPRRDDLHVLCIFS